MFFYCLTLYGYELRFEVPIEFIVGYEAFSHIRLRGESLLHVFSHIFESFEVFISVVDLGITEQDEGKILLSGILIPRNQGGVLLVEEHRGGRLLDSHLFPAEFGERSSRGGIRNYCLSHSPLRLVCDIE